MPSAIVLITDGVEEVEFTTPYDVLVRAGFDTKSIAVFENTQLHQEYVTCSRGVKIIPDFFSLDKYNQHRLKHDDTAASQSSSMQPSQQPQPTISSLNQTLADVLVLPGGLLAAHKFAQSQWVRELVRAHRHARKLVAAICASTLAFVASVETRTEADTDTDTDAHKSQSSTPDDSAVAIARSKVKVTSHPSVKSDITNHGWDYSEERVCVDAQVITSRGPGTALEFSLKIVEIVCGTAKRDEVARPMIVANI